MVKLEGKKKGKEAPGVWKGKKRQKHEKATKSVRHKGRARNFTGQRKFKVRAPKTGGKGEFQQQLRNQTRKVTKKP